MKILTCEFDKVADFSMLIFKIHLTNLIFSTFPMEFNLDNFIEYSDSADLYSFDNSSEANFTQPSYFPQNPDYQNAYNPNLSPSVGSSSVLSSKANPKGKLRFS